MDSKKKDLIGQRFGRLVILRKLDERKYGEIVWEAQCDCGNIVKVTRTNLRSTLSCGCYHKEELAKRKTKNLAGQRFGRLVVIRATEMRKNGYVVWECKCDCGNTTFVTTSNLLRGQTSSCGCLQREKVSETRFLDLTGKRFGRLVAVKPVKNDDKNIILWECKCDCGNTIYVQSNNLQRNRIVSCGCYRRQRVTDDLTGQRFGYLTVIRPTTERFHKYIIWECRCDCGNVINIPSYQLKRSVVASCGCELGDV